MMDADLANTTSDVQLSLLKGKHCGDVSLNSSVFGAGRGWAQGFDTGRVSFSPKEDDKHQFHFDLLAGFCFESWGSLCLSVRGLGLGHAHGKCPRSV